MSTAVLTPERLEDAKAEAARMRDGMRRPALPAARKPFDPDAFARRIRPGVAFSSGPTGAVVFLAQALQHIEGRTWLCRVSMWQGNRTDFEVVADVAQLLQTGKRVAA